MCLLVVDWEMGRGALVWRYSDKEVSGDGGYQGGGKGSANTVRTEGWRGRWCSDDEVGGCRCDGEWCLSKELSAVIPNAIFPASKRGG